jgi:hypothetical protein
MNRYCSFDCLKGNIFITAGQRPAEKDTPTNRCLKGSTGKITL